LEPDAERDPDVRFVTKAGVCNAKADVRKKPKTDVKYGRARMLCAGGSASRHELMSRRDRRLQTHMYPTAFPLPAWFQRFRLEIPQPRRLRLPYRNTGRKDFCLEPATRRPQTLSEVFLCHSTAYGRFPSLPAAVLEHAQSRADYRSARTRRDRCTAEWR